MSRRAILPQCTEPLESYEGRLNFQLNKEIGSLKDTDEQVRMGRLAAYNSATAAPTGNTWAAGDIVRNSAPAEAGVALSKYVVIGWICSVSGTPGTWLEMRTLTGN
jgi:hypothetical protein